MHTPVTVGVLGVDVCVGLQEGCQRTLVVVGGHLHIHGSPSVPDAYKKYCMPAAM